MDSSAPSVLENPKNLAPVMVVPDLDEPGIMATACQIPIIIASLLSQELFVRSEFPYLSLKYKRKPKIIVLQPITFKDRSVSIISVEKMIKPIIMTGAVASRTSRKN